MSPGHRLARAAIAASLSLAVATPTLADPPSWAPAHGWRAKQGKHQDRPVARPTPVILVPTAEPAVLTCDRSVLAQNSTLIGQILGGAAGALAGSQFGQGTGKLAATAGGTLIGVLLGGQIADSVTPADAACAQYALNSAPQGQTVAWNNPDSGDRYQVTLQAPVASSSADYCREYTSSAVVDGRSTTTHGVACRQPDGQWKIMN